MRWMVLHLALAGALLLPGCASRQGPQQDASPAPDDDAVILHVTNNTWSDVDVYVLASSVRARVGSVDSQGSVQIKVSRDLWALGTLQVRVEPVGGAQPYVTDAIEVHGGQRIRLTVEEQRDLSTWQVENLNRW